MRINYSLDDNCAGTHLLWNAAMYENILRGPFRFYSNLWIKGSEAQNFGFDGKVYLIYR